ncbi:MAG: metal-dependent transcriptional regulator [Desulfurococcaceae archaeon]
MRTRAEEYLEALYMLERRGKVGVRELARLLGVRPSSALEFLRKLSEEGYVEYGQGGKIRLTEKGLKVAMGLYERHRLLTEFFVSIGVPRDIAEEDACKVEHYLHEITVLKIAELIKRLGSCGQGTPERTNQ